MTDGSACDICSNVEESVIHIFRDCKAAKRIWHKFLSPTQREEFYRIREDFWFHSNLVSKALTCDIFPSYPWSVIFVACIWSIWKARNYRIFNGKEESANATIFQIKSLTLDLMYLYNKRHGLKRKAWIKPIEGWLKLNVDGRVCANSNRGAAGGVLRDDKGLWVWGFVTTIPQPTVLEAEVEVIRIGLSIAWDHRVPMLEVETDSRDAFLLISDDQIDRHPLMMKIEECRVLLRKAWASKFRWIDRTGNRLADAVVKIPTCLDGKVNMLASPPISVIHVLETDVA